MSGELSGNSAESKMLKAAIAFRSGKAGVQDAKDALDLAISRMSGRQIESIYAAGHSSAATLALLLAANDDRVHGVAAFAPVWNVPEFLGPGLVAALDASNPGYKKFLDWSSPVNHLEALTVPIMLFHAEDDQVVPYKEAMASANRARSAGVKVNFKSAVSGGHYDSMINHGIPAAIEWFQILAPK
jgi:dipeptidyl aminopeptidase/acylaminoacyl peptidase